MGRNFNYRILRSFEGYGWQRTGQHESPVAIRYTDENAAARAQERRKISLVLRPLLAAVWSSRDEMEKNDRRIEQSRGLLLRWKKYPPKKNPARRKKWHEQRIRECESRRSELSRQHEEAVIALQEIRSRLRAEYQGPLTPEEVDRLLR
ncbi:hypothetical protein FNQ90_00845 [Streptomyces alkaliphilus]|uniref:Uncharacterized protein n=1 Tax=Streptomyces alkaliphilus TaxID=1472722 RepID=A0A7W3T9S9_9ACTN|nr:hypothetical protein [Streptomyces alkaliphilus]MBB0242690.1 hypothetical protein [Streptomyces alkaliphilus]